MKSYVDRAQSLYQLYMKVMGEIFVGLKTNDSMSTLTGIQMQALCVLERQGPLRMKDIADSVSVSMPSATGIIDRMVRANLVHRFEDPTDRRVTMVELSAGGAEAMKKINRTHEKRLRELLSRLAPNRQMELIAAFEKIYELLLETQRAAEESAPKRKKAHVEV